MPLTAATAFERVKQLALESAERGDYYAGAVLLDEEKNIVLETGNFVATNEPHGIQAEAELLKQYHLRKEQGEVLPDLANCSLYTLTQPTVAAPQIMNAGIGKCYYAIEDGFAALTDPKFYPADKKAVAASLFEKVSVADEVAISKAIDDTRARVMAEKVKYSTTVLPVVNEFSSEAKHLLAPIPDNLFSPNNFLAGQNIQFSPENNLESFLANPAKLAAMQTDNSNVALAFDKSGKLLAGFRDKCASNPLNTAMMQAVDYFHEIYRLAGAQGKTAESETVLKIENPQTKLPHARDVVFLSQNEVSLMEAARLSQPGNTSTIYMQAHENGVASSGALAQLPRLYQNKKTTTGIKSAEQIIAEKSAASEMAATVPTPVPSSASIANFATVTKQGIQQL